MKITSKENYLIDTNILIYSLDRNSKFYRESRDVLEAGLKGEFYPIIAQQNLIELLAVLTKAYHVSLKSAIKDVISFANNFELITPLPTTFGKFLQIIHSLKTGFYPFDVYLAATMLDNHVKRIITANVKDFQALGLEEVVGIKQP